MRQAHRFRIPGRRWPKHNQLSTAIGRDGEERENTAVSVRTKVGQERQTGYRFFFKLLSLRQSERLIVWRRQRRLVVGGCVLVCVRDWSGSPRGIQPPGCRLFWKRVLRPCFSNREGHPKRKAGEELLKCCSIASSTPTDRATSLWLPWASRRVSA